MSDSESGSNRGAESEEALNLPKFRIRYNELTNE